MKFPCRELYGEVFVHESEDYDKVVKAFSVLFTEKSTKTESVPGVYGTTITIITATIKKKNAQVLIQKILKKMGENDKKEVLGELKLRVSEEGKLYLRFDKQKLYTDEELILTSEEEDSIQVVIALEAYPANLPNFINVAKQLFE